MQGPASPSHLKQYSASPDAWDEEGGTSCWDYFKDKKKIIFEDGMDCNFEDYAFPRCKNYYRICLTPLLWNEIPSSLNYLQVRSQWVKDWSSDWSRLWNPDSNGKKGSDHAEDQKDGIVQGWKLHGQGVQRHHWEDWKFYLDCQVKAQGSNISGESSRSVPGKT